MKVYPHLRKAIHRSFSLTTDEVDYILRDIKHGVGDKSGSELLVHMKRTPCNIVTESFKHRHYSIG